MTGKGSGRRPQKVSSDVFSEEWEKIFKSIDADKEKESKLNIRYYLVQGLVQHGGYDYDHMYILKTVEDLPDNINNILSRWAYKLDLEVDDTEDNSSGYTIGDRHVGDHVSLELTDPHEIKVLTDHLSEYIYTREGTIVVNYDF